VNDLVELHFGTRVVGTLSLVAEQCKGIGVELFEQGLDVLKEQRHYSVSDGKAFLNAVVRQFQGDYFFAA
jgi:hypothetical protein